MSNLEKIQHFGVSVKKSETNRINRNNYAVIDKKSSIWSPKTPIRYCYNQAWKKYYEDEECKIYNDAYCARHQEKCLINFDKNMEFFKQISKEEFEVALSNLIDSNKNITKILDLNDCKDLCGVYIMVLDEYKQVYIGQSTDIKKRIMSHWSKQKEFDRLLWGNVQDSVLSIDSFGALDTTRIFVLETEKLDYYESKLQKKIPFCYKLNRIGGGSINDNLNLLIALGQWNHRSLKDCHNEKYAEKYEKEMKVTYFISNDYCDFDSISTGNVICIEKIDFQKGLSIKYYGKVIKINKTRLFMYQYCGGILGNSCYSYEYDFKDKQSKILSIREFRKNKTMRFSKVEIVEKKEIHTFWRSKKYPDIEA